MILACHVLREERTSDTRNEDPNDFVDNSWEWRPSRDADDRRGGTALRRVERMFCGERHAGPMSEIESIVKRDFPTGATDGN